jgi:hypothetical protein
MCTLNNINNIVPNLLLLDFIVREIGSSINFTCLDDSTKNYKYNFSALKTKRTPELITPGARIKVFGPILMIVDLEWDDNGHYFCSIYDSNGNQIGNQRSLAILSLKLGQYLYISCGPAGSIPARDLFKVHYSLLFLVRSNKYI